MRKQNYTNQDFKRNPGSYFLFSSARIWRDIQSTPCLEKGKVVSVKYHATMKNKSKGDVEMPVFEVWTDDDPELKQSPVLLYACSLHDFSL